MSAQGRPGDVWVGIPNGRRCAMGAPLKNLPAPTEFVVVDLDGTDYPLDGPDPFQEALALLRRQLDQEAPDDRDD